MLKGESHYKVPEIIIDMSLSGKDLGFKDGFSFAIDTYSVKGSSVSCIIGGTYSVKSSKFSNICQIILDNEYSSISIDQNYFSQGESDSVLSSQNSVSSFGTSSHSSHIISSLQAGQKQKTVKKEGESRQRQVSGFSLFQEIMIEGSQQKIKTQIYNKFFLKIEYQLLINKIQHIQAPKVIYSLLFLTKEVIAAKMEKKYSQIPQGIQTLQFFKYECIICSVGSNLTMEKLRFLQCCQINKIPAMLYSYKKESIIQEEQQNFAEYHDIPLVVFLLEKIYIQKKKAWVKAKKEKSKEMNLEEFNAFLSKSYKCYMKNSQFSR